MIFSTVTEADVAGAVVVVVDPPKEKPPVAGLAAAAAGVAPFIPCFFKLIINIFRYIELKF